MPQSKLRNHPHVEMVPRSSLRPNPANPRRHSEKQIEQLARLIERYGFVVPIIRDDDGLIVAGHGRWRASGRLRLDDVPTIRVRFMSEADRRAFALADNRIAELSDWDEDLLKAELEYLFEEEYDLDLIGFDLGDLDLGIPPVADGQEDPVELPDAGAVAISRPGDLWLVGPHRLYCGDSRRAESYEAVLGDTRAAVVFSDPPYGVKVASISGMGRTKHREFAMMSGEQTSAELTAFLRTVFRNCVRFSADGSIHFHCMDWRHLPQILDAGDGVYSELKQLAVWVKTNAGMGSFYRSAHELVLIYKSGNGSHINNFGLGEKGRYRTNVWTYPGANTFRKGRDEDLQAHPTVKPLAMVIDILRDCSRRGDVALDPFSGSGTTLVAAHRTGRRGAAIEIDPLFVDTGLRRLTAVSGLTPVLADGRSFDEVAAERRTETVDG